MKIKSVFLYIVLLCCVLMIGSVSVNAETAYLNKHNTLSLSNSSTKYEFKDKQRKSGTKTGKQTEDKNKLLPQTAEESELLVIYIGWLLLLVSLILFSVSFQINKRNKKHIKR